MSKRYVGERILQNCGEYAEIIELLPEQMCKVRFDSGVERECPRHYFAEGIVTKRPRLPCSKRYIGERVLQKCGDYAEIIELLPENKCRVRFDNGVERLCLRNCFTGGEVSNTISYRTDRGIGERILQNCGEYAELIELLPNRKCRVRFDSGVEKICWRRYFKEGAVSSKPSHANNKSYRFIGERILQKCGEYAEIIELLPNGECRVRFDGGVEKICLRQSFGLGGVRIDSYRIFVEERVLQNCGATAEVVKLNEDNLCTVRWEDGSECMVDRTFFRHHSALPKFIKKRGMRYVYSKTMEILLSMYFDTYKGCYVGVLRRADGTRYVRVLKENGNE